MATAQLGGRETDICCHRVRGDARAWPVWNVVTPAILHPASAACAIPWLDFNNGSS